MNIRFNKDNTLIMESYGFELHEMPLYLEELKLNVWYQRDKLT